MNTFISAVLVGLVGVFCMWDSRLLGRLNFEQPLVGATLVGLLLGDVPTGLAVGAAVELVSMGLVQVGAAVPPDMVLGGIVAAAFACLTDASAETAMTIAITTELLTSRNGLGARIWMAWETLRTENLYATLIVISVTGLLINLLLVWLERRLMPWSPVTSSLERP